MPVTQEEQYRRINLEFLNNSGNEAFDIFFRTRNFGTIKFVKFASSNPRHHEKVRRLLESGEILEEFFIQEDDLFKYYRHATHSLRNIVSNPQVPFETKAKKVYDVSKDIMKEFFEYNASDKILSSSNEVMELMEGCFQDAEVGFYGISKITNKDYYTYTHSVNVGLYCMTYGLKLQMKPEEIRQLGLGGLLHDVGKSRISGEILNKKGSLTSDEFEIIKDHASFGGEILSEMDCYGSAVVHMAEQHHEKYCGGGYPHGLKGDAISPYARICKVMDVYDALTTRRSYKKAMSAYDTLTLMKKQMTDEFDADILDKFIRFMGPEL